MMEGDQRMVSTTTQRKKKMSKNSRRFNDEQIKSMETIFRVEAKLEPRKKLQVAGELGLQPRQVAIWFQNKRARWKSKQIEQEYTSLKADYDELDSRFESLKKEKHSSLIQLQKLRDQLNTDGEGVRESNKKVVLEGKSIDSCSENGAMKIQVKGKSSSLSGGIDEDMLMYSDEELDRRMNVYDIAEREGDEFQRLGAEQAGSFSEVRAERIRGFELDDGLFNQPCATPTWWDFWS